MSEQFNLVNHTNHILKIAAANNLSVEAALQRFVENLTTMKEHYQGCPELNYHELGQRWNRLLSREKVAQKTEALARLQKYPKGGRS